jgi:hypothetical protein
MESHIGHDDQAWTEPADDVSGLPVLELALRTHSVAPPAPGQLTLRCSLVNASPVRLSVHDAAGHRVRLLHEGWLAAGEHAIAWDRTDEEGRRIDAGLYLLRLEAAGSALSQKVLLMP